MFILNYFFSWIFGEIMPQDFYYFPFFIPKEENAKDQAIIDAEPLPKPEPPEALDERTLKDQIKAKFMAQKRRPGNR